MTIRLYWTGGDRNEINFGDTISPMVVELMSGKKVVYSHPATCDMAAIGSILDKVVSKQWKRIFKLRFSPVQVWGSGSFGPDVVKHHKFLQVHAVRGPLTRDAMALPKNLALGDPGLLVDRFPINTKKKYRWGIIPHVIDRGLPVMTGMNAETKNSTIINLGDPDVLGVLQTIASCEFIVSSSLHGLITADALGIPHIWTRVSDKIYGGDWKFDDYFASVGRSVSGPLKVQGDLKQFEKQADHAARKIIKQRQDELEAAFKSINL